jgi:hypothetical protein
VAFSRSFDGSDRIGSESIAGGRRIQEERRSTRTTHLASGSLACPACDAPVSLSAPVCPADSLVCPFCGHTGPTRAFLSLAAPTRPARVEVHVRMGRVRLAP